MKTFILRKEDVKKQWYHIDGTDQIVGRMAIKIATILNGKNKPEYTPGVDSGDYVIVTNSEKVQFSGKKAETKKYYWHSFFPGGLKEATFEHLMQTHPERVIEHAVKGMLPKNKLQKQMLKRLRIYSGSEHPHAAMKPITIQ